MDKQNVIKAMFRTKVKLAVVVCAALVVAIGCAGLAQPAPAAEGAKQPLAKNIIHVAADGSGDYKTDGTDDHVEINKALQDIHKKGGGTVHIKKGTYTISDSIIVHDNTILEGDGWSTVINLRENVDWPARRKPMVGNAKGAHDITIRNLKIDGQRGKQKVGWGGGYHRGIDLVGASNVTMTGLWIGNNCSDAIHLLRSKNIIIRNNTLYSCGHDGVHAYHSEAIKIINNRIVISCNVAIRLANTNHGVIRGNIMYPVFGQILGIKSTGGKGGNGIQFQFYYDKKMDDILVENNVVFRTNGSGINAWTDNPPKKPSICRITVRNNVFHHCRGGGITTSNFDMLVENNTFFSNRHGIAFHAHLRAVSFPVTVTARNNIIANNRGHGLTTSGLKNARILSSYNDVWNNGGGNYDGNVTVKHDISVDPLFADAHWRKRLKGDRQLLKMGLHLKSRHGRWDGEQWVKDDVTSPCIDAGDPSFAYSKEPDPNGGRINLGGYGNTEHASKSTGMARGTISGKVTDKTTGKPVSGAKLSTGGYFGTTDSDGNYTILNVPAGEYSLKVSAIRYVEQVRDKTNVSKDGKTAVDLGLEIEKVPPTVKSHSPSGKNPVGRIISVIFSEPMNIGSAEKSLSISPSAAGSFKWINSTMYFIPEKSLEYGTKYKMTVEGAEDLAGNKLQSPCVWEFSTLSKAEHLIGEWRFEEESGDTVKDSSGRGNHGTLGSKRRNLGGKPARVEGKIGKALSFNGEDDVVEVPHNDSLVAREEITIEAWVKPEYQAKLHGIFCGVVGKFHRGYDGYQLLSYTRKTVFRPNFKYRDGKGKNAYVDFKHEGVFDSWSFIAVTRDLHGNVKTYVNGKQTGAVKTDPIMGVIVGSEKPCPLWMGYTAHGRRFKGIIDEVRIYNRALSAAEIKADFERTE